MIGLRMVWLRVCGGKPETCTNAMNGRGGGLGVGAKWARACRGRGVARHARAVAAAHTPLFGLLPETPDAVQAPCCPGSRARPT